MYSLYVFNLKIVCLSGKGVNIGWKYVICLLKFFLSLILNSMDVCKN